jgi:hypothetical protein
VRTNRVDESAANIVEIALACAVRSIDSDRAKFVVAT